MILEFQSYNTMFVFPGIMLHVVLVMEIEIGCCDLQTYRHQQRTINRGRSILETCPKTVMGSTCKIAHSTGRFGDAS